MISVYSQLFIINLLILFLYVGTVIIVHG